MAAGFKLFGLFHREDRWVKERSFCQALVTKLEKIVCTNFGPKTFRGCWTLITTLHCVDYFPCNLGCNLLPSYRVVVWGNIHSWALKVTTPSGTLPHHHLRLACICGEGRQIPQAGNKQASMGSVPIGHPAIAHTPPPLLGGRESWCIMYVFHANYLPTVESHE